MLETRPDGKSYRIWPIDKARAQVLSRDEPVEPGDYLVDESGRAVYRSEAGSPLDLSMRLYPRSWRAWQWPGVAAFAVLVAALLWAGLRGQATTGQALPRRRPRDRPLGRDRRALNEWLAARQDETSDHRPLITDQGRRTPTTRNSHADAKHGRGGRAGRGADHGRPRCGPTRGCGSSTTCRCSSSGSGNGFEPTPEWIEHVRLSAVRFNSGGSGSFVSGDGLVMTNHHVGADTLAKISTAGRDYYKTGFYARTREEEVKAPDLELNVVVAIEDVTDRVNADVKDGLTDAEAEVARRKAIAAIEKESLDATGLRSDVVKLYQGGRYHLYRYKAYTDVRLVFAPEFDIAFFGGDPDNFEYPRYDLDVCFFRAYEDGKPARIEHFLRWSKVGTKEGDLVFVPGNPGRTSRLNTVAHLEYLRDTAFPFLLEFLKDKEAFLIEYSARGPEQARQAKEYLFGIQNSRKARVGGFEGLNDAGFLQKKRAAEEALRSRIASDEARKAKFAGAWDRVAAAEKAAGATLLPASFLERGQAFDTDLFGIARTLVRLADEDAKPNADRLREYQDAGRKPLELALYSEAPVYPEFEAARLAHSLAFWKAKMPDHPLVKEILGDKDPEAVAQALVEGSKLADVEVRRHLAQGGQAAIDACDDPMIALVKKIDAAARAVRKQREDEVESVEAAAYAQIARAMFEEYGDAVYPDATFTLRLAFGTVKGYKESDGRTILPYTTIGGLFEHAQFHGNVPPYRIPESWVEAEDAGRLDLTTPLNFVSTADIIGGNSGSPVVDRKGELVGIIFDGNIQSLVLDFGYSDDQARAVSVDCRGIVEALESVYKADGLLKELTGG